MESDPLCLHDCTESNTYASEYLPSDRRYWLLTVLAGYFSTEDYPIIEDKLAKLYRMAFSRFIHVLSIKPHPMQFKKILGNNPGIWVYHKILSTIAPAPEKEV